MRERCPVSSRVAAIPGATALKQAVSSLLGVRVDYYALVNLRGFADLVDGARRCPDPRQGAARRRGDAAGMGRAEASDRRPARPPLPLLRPRGARLRPLAQGLERLHADGAAALLPLARWPTSSTRCGCSGTSPALARTVETERVDGRTAAAAPGADPARRGNRPEGDADGDLRRATTSRAAGSSTTIRSRSSA